MVLLLGLSILAFSEEESIGWTRLWVGFATLWFLWPIVLAVHGVKSVRRALIPLGIAAPFVFVWCRSYIHQFAPGIFGMPSGVSLTPVSILEYSGSYVSGWLQAKQQVRTGHFALEGYGFGFSAPKAPNFSKEALKQCGIEALAVAGCVVNTRIEGHAAGWNDATMSALRHRCPDIVKAAEDEDARWHQSYYDGERAGRQDALDDLKAGGLAIEVSDSPKQDADFERMLRERYQIGLRRVYPHADPKLMNNVFGHNAGYNRVADKEIRRGFGKAADESIWTEWAKLSISATSQ